MADHNQLMDRSEVTGVSGYSGATTTLLGLSRPSRSQRNALSSLLRRGLAGSLAVALSPWRFLLAWVSWWSGHLLSALSYLGAIPSGFLPYSKVSWRGHGIHGWEGVPLGQVEQCLRLPPGPNLGP